MSDDFPSRALDKIVIRAPDGLRDQLRAAAEANKRSMNAEIVARLEDSFTAAGGLDTNTLLDHLREWREFAMEAVRDLDRLRAKADAKPD